MTEKGKNGGGGGIAFLTKDASGKTGLYDPSQQYHMPNGTNHDTTDCR